MEHRSPGSRGDGHPRLRLVEGHGRDEEWKKLAVRHSALIRRSIGRVLRDSEEVENAYVAVLTRLENTPPEDFGAQRCIEAWLTVVSTRVAIDRSRLLYGRRRDPEGLRDLDPMDRRVFELCHREDLDFRLTLERLEAEGHAWTVRELSAAYQRVERVMTSSLRRKLAQERRARHLGRPRRLVEILDHVYTASVRRQADASPELDLLRREARRLQGRLDVALATLDARDRELLRRYYYEDESAAAIDVEMEFGGVRKVHTALERLRRELRRKLEELRTDDGPLY